MTKPWRDRIRARHPRPTLADLDASPEPARWCCGGNAEDCVLCTDPNLPYPFLCPGHPRTAANERIVGDTAQPATEATELESLRREVSAARKFAAEMRDFCSPHGVAVDYADRLIEAMDRARGAR